jgi:hypothetical protein
MKKLRIPIILLMTFSFLLFSCKDGSEKRGGNLEGLSTDVEEDDEKIEIPEVEESIIYLFPAPGEVLDRFYESNVSFDQELLNPEENQEEYLTTRSKALNLGIYFTDFAYSVVFSRQQEAMDYLDVLNAMSKEVDIAPAVYESLIERTEENIGSRDSLLNISRDMFFTILEYLEQGQKESTMALVSAGAYIEAMYIALQSIEEYKEDHPILQHITELRYPMNNLLERARATSNNPHVSSIVIYLLEIQEVFEELEDISTDTRVVKKESNEISITGGEKKKISEEDFVELKNKIAEIRTNITQN